MRDCCHVGFIADAQPVCDSDAVRARGRRDLFSWLGGEPDAARSAAGVLVCVTVTLTDGLVLARSVFNHSMNYRSVVALGKATLVDAPAEKLEALHNFTEKILPGRWEDARQPNEKELKATSILKLPLAEIFREGSLRPCAGR